MNSSREREERLRQLLEIVREWVSLVALEALLPRILDVAATVTDADMAAILMPHGDGEELGFAAATKAADRLADVRLPVRGTVTGKVFSSGKPLLITKVSARTRYDRHLDELFDCATRSLLAVRLQIDKRHPTGVLQVWNKRGGEGFNIEDRDVLIALSLQAAVAIENARLIERLQEEHSLAEALREAGAAVSGTLERNQVIERILDQIGRVVPHAAASIMLVEGNEAQVFRGRGYEQLGVSSDSPSITFQLDKVATFRRMLESGESLVIADIGEYDDWTIARPEHAWIKSYVGVPIRRRDEVIGFLNVNSPIPGFFDQKVAERLQAFADHAAIAVENASLYDLAQIEIAERARAEEELRQYQDHLEETVKTRTAELTASNEQLAREVAERARAEAVLQRRNQELAALNVVAQALSGSLDLEDILTQALVCMMETLGFGGGIVSLTAEGTEDLQLAAHAGLSDDGVESLRARGLGGTPCDIVYRQGKPLSIPDLTTDTPGDASLLVAAGLRSYVGVPIIYHRQVLGTFGLVDTAPRVVADADYPLLASIGQQIGTAVANAHLFRDVVRERQASDILLDTARALSTTLRVDLLLERVLDELQRVVPYDAALITMLRDERCWTVASRGLQQVPLKPFALSERPLVQRVVLEQGPVIISAAQDSPDWTHEGTLEIVQSWLGVPMVVKDVVIGVLTIDSRHPAAYDEATARLALAFAHQVALAIENSRLYEYVQAQLRDANLLHSVTMALSSTLDAAQILSYVARSLCEILNSSAVEIYTLDEECVTITLSARYALAADGGTDQEGGTTESQAMVDLPAIAEFVSQRHPVQVRLDDPKGDLRLQAMIEDRGAKAALLLPLVSADRVLGFAMVLEGEISRRFAESELAMGQTLIHQAAIAVYNAHLVEALRSRTIELEVQNAELDAFSHTVAHDLKSPLTTIIGFGKLLNQRLSQLSDEQLRHNLEIIEQNGRKMVNIIEALLLLASVRKMEDVEMGRLDMAGIVGEVNERIADSARVYHATMILPESWPVVEGYAPWIEEVWVNYVSNALKYGGRPPTVELGATELEEGMVRFWVQDNGPGLTAGEQAQLFTPFTRLHQERAEGHGLGLSIVQRIVEKMGGQVGVESRVGEGSRFYFALPAVSRPQSGR